MGHNLTLWGTLGKYWHLEAEIKKTGTVYDVFYCMLRWLKWNLWRWKLKVKLCVWMKRRQQLKPMRRRLWRMTVRVTSPPLSLPWKLLSLHWTLWRWATLWPRSFSAPVSTHIYTNVISHPGFPSAIWHHNCEVDEEPALRGEAGYGGCVCDEGH